MKGDLNEQTLSDLLALRQSYEREGYVVIRNALDPSELDPMRERVTKGVDAFARELRAKGEIESLYENESFERRIATLCANRKGTRKNPLAGWHSKVKTDRTLGPEVYDIYTHPVILKVLTTLLGLEVTNDGVHDLRLILPGGKGFAWHQDSQYYSSMKAGVFLNKTERTHIVTTWVPLVPVTERNSCLWVIPGSRQWGLLHGKKGDDGMIHQRSDIEAKGEPVPVPMNPGDLLLFSNLTFHSSKANSSRTARWSMDFRCHATAGSTPEEREGIALREGLVRALGNAPLVVHSANRAATSYEDWVAQHSGQDNRDAFVESVLAEARG